MSSVACCVSVASVLPCYQVLHALELQLTGA